MPRRALRSVANLAAGGGDLPPVPLAAGRHVLAVAGAGVAAWRLGFEIAEGIDCRLEVPLRAGQDVRLAALAPAGVRDVTLHIHDGDGRLVHEREMVPAGSGFAARVALAPGRYRVALRGDGGAQCEAPLAIERCDPDPREVRLELR
jgi:hypothetical protein